jgi:hypothetical protein
MEKAIRQVIREAFNSAFVHFSLLNEAKMNITPEQAANVLKSMKDTPDFRNLKFGKVDDKFLNEVLSILIEEYKQNPSQELAWAIAMPFTDDSIAMRKIVLPVVNNLKKGFGQYNIYNEAFLDIYKKAWSLLFTTTNERTGTPMLFSIVSKGYGESKIEPMLETFDELIQDSNLSEEYKIIAHEHYANRRNAKTISDNYKEYFPTPEDAHIAIENFKNDPAVISIGKEAFRKNQIPESSFTKFNPMNPEALFGRREADNLSKIITAFKNQVSNATRTANITATDVSLDAPLGGSGDEDDTTMADKLKSKSGDFNPELQGVKGYDVSQSTYGDVASETGSEFNDASEKLGKVYDAFKEVLEFAKSLNVDPKITTAAEEVYVNGINYDNISAKYPELYPTNADVRTALKRYITMMTGKKIEPAVEKIFTKYGLPTGKWEWSDEAQDELWVPLLSAVPPKEFFKSGESETAQKKKMRSLGSIDTSKRQIWEEEISDEEVDKIFEMIIKKINGK